ncbi:hypothetical protein BRYFOR_07391 [Marvinbryantia formatexigens DSM 14469]|uniref:Uncharacterized protein n=1 Tax=Marvinbryantia formatexigens DSM 14469 TaxID=478749 RepID=C6LFI8_9FIRM|nr:DUF2142 domain-containing protein [Marvinbryantia formatexigens]EET60573.1 hypothetical protein BRYFOR_07391 [Marvinbryantia formatexigens DSM 14469]UWO25568.1 DUF2142 domain-containing protein [Marvinbryantia formatexigens DSM 14469]SDG19463.1 Uncharacterized membrane protein [Marvinbryantia formatexigens]
MAVLEKIKKYKRLIAVFVILLLTGLVETGYNYPSLRNGYDSLNLGEAIRTEQEGDTERYVIEYRPENGLYVKQIRLSGRFPKEYEYTVQVTEVNAFGKETEVTYTDTVNAWFKNFYTDLNKTVTAIKIVLDKPEGAELTGAVCTNRAEINKYRVLFFLAVFSLLYCALFEENFCRKTEWYVVLYGAVFGLLIILYAQPVKISWDEQIHFRNAYRLSYGKTVEWSESAVHLQNWTSVKCNTKAEYAQLRAYRDEKGEEYAQKEEKETIVPSYNSLAYIPQALFLWIGRLLDLPFSSLYAFGKIGNLLVYLLTMFWAVRLAKTKKLFLAFFAMMPTVIFQASSYTYDSIVNCFLTLGCVLWANHFFFREGKTRVRDIILMVLFMLLGSLSKAVYIPLLLLVLLLPWFRERSRKEKVIFWGGIFLLCGLVMATFVLPTLINTVTGNLAFGGDSRGGDTGAAGQLLSMLQHPLASVRLILQNVTQLDNFRNLGAEATDNFFFGNLMFLNFATAGILGDKWSALLVPAFTVLLLYRDPAEKERRSCTGRQTFIIVTIGLVTVILIWLAMYLSFTPIGESYIAGVQARYYLPLIYLGALLLSGKRISVQCDKVLMTRLAFVSAGILGFAGLYQCFLQGRLI